MLEVESWLPEYHCLCVYHETCITLSTLSAAPHGSWKVMESYTLSLKLYCNIFYNLHLSSFCCCWNAFKERIYFNSHFLFLFLIYQHDDTVLIHAVKGGQTEVVKLLLKKFADVDIQGDVSIEKTFICLLIYKRSSEFIAGWMVCIPVFNVNTWI